MPLLAFGLQLLKVGGCFLNIAHKGGDVHDIFWMIGAAATVGEAGCAGVLGLALEADMRSRVILMISAGW